MEKNNAPKTLFGWLGFNEHPDYSKHRTLGHFLGWLLQAVVLLLFILGVTVIIQFAAAAFGPVETSHEAIRNIGLVAAAILGVPFLIWRSVVAQKQVDVAEQSHITDRISKAVEQLGAEKVVKYHRTNAKGTKLYEDGPDGKPDFKKPIFNEETKPNIEVRMGGIFALERIGKDSPDDHLQIMEILTAYIRENAPASSAENPSEPAPKRPKDTSDVAAMQSYLFALTSYYRFGGAHWQWAETLKPRNDIQAAITVIGRRSADLRALEITTDTDGATTPIRLDLRKTCLQGADMQAGQFDNARFDGSRMEATLLDRARLNKAELNWARLNGARLNKAELNEARLNEAELNWAALNKAELNRAALNKAELNGARLNKAELNEARLNGAALYKTDFTAAHTRLAAVKSADLSESVNLDQDQVKSMFGDATTTLPKGMTPPDWHAEELDWGEFFERWGAAKKEDGIL